MQPFCHRSPVAASIATNDVKCAGPVGWVFGRKYSVTVFDVPGPGAKPVNASTLARTRPLGGWNDANGMPFETSDRIADHRGADESSESEPLFGSLFELPIQTPTTSAGSFLSFGGATKPEAWTSRLSLVVPVLYAAGRTRLLVTPFVICHLPQNGFTCMFVLPARMSVMMYAAAADATRLPAAGLALVGQTTSPLASRTSRTMCRGMRTPPFAIAPYAPVRSIGWISSVPMLSEMTGPVPGA